MNDIDRRLEEVRRLMRERHAGIEPDTEFASRVAARLPHESAWPLVWAARRMLPVSLGLAALLLIAVLLIGPAASATSAPTAVQTDDDPVSWVLESRGDAG